MSSFVRSFLRELVRLRKRESEWARKEECDGVGE
jgi:hypothetical protein